MAAQKDSPSTITIDLETLLTPLSILVSAVMISASILYSFNGNTVARNSATAPVASGDGTLTGLAQEIDIDVDKFSECIADNDYSSEIAKDTSDGQAAGISGTPGFIVGNLSNNGIVKGSIISGAQPYSVFQAAIDKALDGDEDGDVTVSIDDDPIKGNKSKVKVALVEFSDFECPFCQRYHNETFDQIIKNYVDTGKIAYVYRDFPLSFHEPKASEAAAAANCVKEIAGDDKYFEFSKLYYASTQSNGQGL